MLVWQMRYSYSSSTIHQPPIVISVKTVEPYILYISWQLKFHLISSHEPRSVTLQNNSTNDRHANNIRGRSVRQYQSKQIKVLVQERMLFIHFQTPTSTVNWRSHRCTPQPLKSLSGVIDSCYTSQAVIFLR